MYIRFLPTKNKWAFKTQVKSSWSVWLTIWNVSSPCSSSVNKNVTNRCISHCSEKGSHSWICITWPEKKKGNPKTKCNKKKKSQINIKSGSVEKLISLGWEVTVGQRSGCCPAGCDPSEHSPRPSPQSSEKPWWCEPPWLFSGQRCPGSPADCRGRGTRPGPRRPPVSWYTDGCTPHGAEG